MKGRIASLAGVACAAAALALAAPALAAQNGGRPAVSGTEHIQIMSTSATSSTLHVIAYGVFTAGGIDHGGSKVDKFVFPNGSIRVRHVNSTGGKHSFNPKTCLGKVTQPGTFKILSGTGKYAGITGHGKFLLHLLFIGARNAQGHCTQDKPPVAFQVVIQAAGTVKL